MKLEDIRLKAGDIVELIDIDKKQKKIILEKEWEGFHPKFLVQKGREILKIERPTKYKLLYEKPQQILDKEEKEYLEAVIRPFKDRVRNVMKYNAFDCERISISFYRDDLVKYGFTDLPEFKEGTMYKGMELDREYTLEELGLFKE